MAASLWIGFGFHGWTQRITQAEKFSIFGGSENTHEKMTETLCKTFEDLTIKGKALEEISQDELSDLISKKYPERLICQRLALERNDPSITYCYD